MAIFSPSTASASRLAVLIRCSFSAFVLPIKVWAVCSATCTSFSLFASASPTAPYFSCCATSTFALFIASAAAFLPGPLMSCYYATKAYILHLTLAINEELKHDNSDVYIGALCPGPVDTEFNKIAKVKFTVKSLSSEYVTKYALTKMFKKKKIIIPGNTTKFAITFSKLLPMKLKLIISYHLQKSKKQK